LALGVGPNSTNDKPETGVCELELSVRERLVLLSVLPRESDYLTLKIIRGLKEELGFSEEEHKLYKFVNNGDSVTWDDTVEQGKEVVIGEKATDIIAGSLKELNRIGKLRDDHFDIYERFVGDK
jgi:hypothetical protein